MTDLVSINGHISRPDEAKISVYDRGFLFGDAVYEVTRSYGKVLFALEEHIWRLRRSAEAINLDLGKSDQEIAEQMYALTRKAGSENIYIRIQVSRGNCAMEQVSLKPNNSSAPNFVMYLHPLKEWAKEYYSRGIRLASSSIHRNPKGALDPNIKSGNYLNSILGVMNTKEKADDCILLNPDNLVTEGSTFNVFMVKDGCVITPPDEANILRGITRSIVCDLTKELGISLERRSFSWEEYLEADEAFSSSATKEIMPIYSLNSKVITDKPGVITSKLMLAYKNYVKTYCEKAQKDHSIGW